MKDSYTPDVIQKAIRDPKNWYGRRTDDLGMASGRKSTLLSSRDGKDNAWVWSKVWQARNWYFHKRGALQLEKSLSKNSIRREAVTEL